MLAPDGKIRLRDAMKTSDIFRLVESIPSKKAEPFKVWLGRLGSERIEAQNFYPQQHPFPK